MIEEEVNHARCMSSKRHLGVFGVGLLFPDVISFNSLRLQRDRNSPVVLKDLNRLSERQRCRESVLLSGFLANPQPSTDLTCLYL